jgi:hypothetical protein
MADVDIKPADSALPYALEQYYAELIELIGERTGEPVLLNNTITTLDITEKAPFYTEGVFRQFADRKYRQSPDNLGTAIQADRFSFEYERALNVASSDIDESLSTEVSTKIKAYQKELSRLNRKLVNFETDVADKWQKIVTLENLDPTSTTYQLRHINFLEAILYADQRNVISDDIGRYTRQIDVVRGSVYSPAQKKLLLAKSELADAYKIARPWNTYFERDFPEATVFTFADPRYRSRQLCDVSPAIYPSLDLVNFQIRGGTKPQRAISISQTTVHNELHTRTWGAAGGGSFSLLGIKVGGGGGGSGESSYKRDFKQIRNVSIDFAGIEEVYANHGLWYDPSLFKDADLKPIFDSIPGARDLEFVAVSLIIARGLTLTLEFSDKVEEEQWSRKKFRGSGGVSVFGYRFGGASNSSAYDYDFKLSEDKKIVTFADDQKHCRLLAVRLERIYHPSRVAFPEKHMELGAKVNELVQRVQGGQLSSSNYQELKLSGFSEEALSRVLAEIKC